MLRNEKFAWMLDYREPEINVGFMKTIYWMNMYRKIRRDGTADEVAKLLGFYEEAYRNEVSFRTGLFSFKQNLWFHHRYACRAFIHWVRKEHYADEDRRRELAQREKARQERKRYDRRYFGDDFLAKAQRLYLMEAELDAHAVGNDDRNVYQPGRVITLSEMRQRCQVLEEIRWPMTVHGVETDVFAYIFDKFNGRYHAIISSSARPRNEQGKLAFINLDNERLNDGHGKGLIYDVFYELKREQIRVTMNDFRTASEKLAERQQRKSRTRRSSEPDISKVNAALGIDGNCGDDLDSDIF